MRIRIPSAEQRLYAANILADKLLFSKQVSISPQTILVVKCDEIGDMATATHVFQSLKQAYPAAHLTVLCKPFVKPLIVHDPFIDEILTELAAYQSAYDLVVELRGTWSTLRKSILHKGRYRVSRAEVRMRNKGRQLHETETNLAIIRPVITAESEAHSPRLYASDADMARVRAYLALNHIEKYAIIHAGARRKLRQWNLDRFAAVAQYLHQRYRLEICLAGGAEDYPDIQYIKSLLDFPVHDLSTGFSLSEFSAFCSMATFYIGNESGPMHIASAFKVPMLGLFGPGVPTVFYPHNPHAKVLHHVLSCNPCDQIHCVHPENPCISRILLSDVLEKIDEILPD